MITEKTLKKEMLDTCIEQQQLLIDDFKGRIKSLLETEGLGNEEEYDNNVLAKKNQGTEEIASLHGALQLATEEMNWLQHLKTMVLEPHTRVEPGAVVVTDSDTFFISVSIEQFEVGGEAYVGISSRSPLYLAMKGLTTGKKFTYKEAEYTILDIF